MALSTMYLSSRHIQNMSEATSLQRHWGYADRAVPCTNDAGSCAYLDVVYHSHDLGMMYCGIMWASILAILFLWVIYKWSSASPSNHSPATKRGEHLGQSMTTYDRILSTLATYRRQYLLPEFARPIFGRTTRTQILVLAVLTGYLTIFSFVGIVYNTWVTPVEKMSGVHNTRTSLGPFADRVGVLAYALTPLSVLLGSRESLLSLVTGLPYQSFNFLHRWLGYIIVMQSILHTVGWCVIEMRLYQPQPSVGIEWIKQLYMIWGVIAMFLLFVLFVLSTPWAIKRTGYEFFRKSHYILAMLYIGACWGHWSKLSCYLIPALIVWLIDRAIRLVRTGLLHYNYIDGGSTMRLSSTDAQLTLFNDPVNGDVVRLDFLQQQEPWQVGQHFYLCFPKLSIWQSHPFTPLNVPISKAAGVPHSYIFRGKSGETAKVARMAQTTVSTPVILNGPYGVSEVDHLTSSTNILCIAGGTGITYVLPVVLSQIGNCACTSERKMQLVWAIRKQSDMAWIKAELEQMYRASKAMDLKISVYVTREDAIGARKNEEGKSIRKEANIVIDEKSLSSSSIASSSSKNTDVGGCCNIESGEKMLEADIVHCDPSQSLKQSITIQRRGSIGAVPPEVRHPDLAELVKEFVSNTVAGPTTVYASGPGGMISDLRFIVSGVNDGTKVWKGDSRGIVDLRCDDRLEW